MTQVRALGSSSRQVHAVPHVSGRLDADFIGLAYDLLAIGDLMAVGTSGLLSTLLWAIVASVSVGTSVSMVHLCVQFGGHIATTALIAPFVLRSARTPRGWDLRDQGAVARGLLRRLSILLVLMLPIGLVTHSLKEVPAALLMVWTILGGGALWGNRLLLASHLNHLERRGTLGDVIAIVGAGHGSPHRASSREQVARRSDRWSF
jgi:hypothetical protein